MSGKEDIYLSYRYIRQNSYNLHCNLRVGTTVSSCFTTTVLVMWGLELIYSLFAAWLLVMLIREVSATNDISQKG